MAAVSNNNNSSKPPIISGADDTALSVTAGAVSMLKTKTGPDKTEKPAGGEKNQKSDSVVKKVDAVPESGGQKFFRATATAVGSLAETFFHIDHRLRKWYGKWDPRKNPAVANDRIVADKDHELTKKIEAFKNALPLLVEFAVKKSNEKDGIKQAVNKFASPLSAMVLLNKWDKIKTAVTGPRKDPAGDCRAQSEKLLSRDMTAHYEKIPALARAALATTGGATKAIGEALDQFPLFEDPVEQAAFKATMLQFVEQVVGPLTSSFKGDARHLIQTVIVMSLHAIAAELKQPGAPKDPMGILNVAEKHFKNGLESLARIAFKGEAEEVSKAMPKVMKELFQPLRDFEAFVEKAVKGEIVDLPKPVPDQYWEKLKRKDFPELNALIDEVKAQYNEYIESLAMLAPVMQLRDDFAAQIEKMKNGQERDDAALRQLTTKVTALEESLAKIGKASPLYKLVKILDKEIASLPAISHSFIRYQKAVANIKTADATGKKPPGDDCTMLQVAGEMGLDTVFGGLKESLDGNAYKFGNVNGWFLPIIEKMYGDLQTVVKPILEKHKIELS